MMRRLVPLLALGLVLALLPIGPPAGGQGDDGSIEGSFVIGTTRTAAGRSSVVVVDLLLEEAFEADEEIPFGISALTLSNDGVFPFLASASDDPSSPGFLIGIQSEEAEDFSPIGDLFPDSTDTVDDLTFTSDGVLLGWSQQGDDLVRIDHRTGAATVVGDSGLVTPDAGLTTGPDDILYLLSGNNLYTVDPATGRPSAPRPLTGDAAPMATEGMDFGCGGELLAVADRPGAATDEIVRIDAENATATIALEAFENMTSAVAECLSLELADPNVSTYDIVTDNGKVTRFPTGSGGFGSAAVRTPSGLELEGEVVGMAAEFGGLGYWLVTSDGKVFAFGLAFHAGDMAGVKLSAPIVGIAPTPSGFGYWLVARDGGVFAFGDAKFLGSMGGKRLNQPIVGVASSVPDFSEVDDFEDLDELPQGYWLVAADGGIFSFGPGARYHGSTGNIRLRSPIVGMAAHPLGLGYWLVAEDGGVFAFGRGVRFRGSTGGRRLNAPVRAMTPTGTGDGYWLVTRDGGVFAFGDAEFSGSLGGRSSRPVVGIAAPVFDFVFG